MVLLKTWIVGTRSNFFEEVVLMCTHNLCFRAKIRKNDYPVNIVLLIKMGLKGIYTRWKMLS